MRLSIFIALIFTITGCARHDRAWQPPRPIGADIPSYRAPLQTSSTTSFENPTGDLTLQQALRQALLQNPELMSTAWDVRIAEADQSQAGLWSNPEIELEVENLDEPETTILLSQLVELGWKRSQRVKQTRLTTELAAWEYEAKRIAVLTETSRAFIDLLVAQENLKLVESLHDITNQIHQAVKDRVEAGRVSPIELSRSRIEVSTAKLELNRTRTDLKAARLNLATMWGGTTTSFEQAIGELQQTKHLPPLIEVRKLITQNPEFAHMQAEIELRRAKLSLERRASLPDLTVSGGIKRADELPEDVYIVGVAMELPLFNQNQGARRAAQYDVHKAEYEQTAAQISLTTQLETAYQSLQTAEQEVKTYRETLMPSAQETMTAIRDGYETGGFGLLDLLDTQRTLSEVQSGWITALQQYHHALLEVEALIGQSLD